METAISTLLFKKHLNLRDIKNIKKIGINFIEEISGYNEITNEVYEYMVKNNMGICSTHYNWEKLDISDADEKKRIESIKVIKRDVEKMKNINGQFVIVHPIASEKPGAGLIDKKNRNIRINLCINSLIEIVKYAYLNRVTILIENTFSCYGLLGLGNNIEEFNHVLKKVRQLSGHHKNIALCLDTGHANLTNNLLDYIDFFKQDIKEIHLHDNYGSPIPEKLSCNEDCHLPPGFGKINWELFFNKLEKTSIKPLIVFENKLDYFKNKGTKFVLSSIEKFIKEKNLFNF